MKKFNWIKALILNYVTCGIYSLYMWFVMAKNNNAMADKYGQKKIANFIVAILLGYITCGIYAIVWQFKFYKLQVAIAEANGAAITPVKKPILLTIITFVPVYSFYVLCTNYNNCVEADEA